MRRFALAIVVALLTFSASGISALIVAEPCTMAELGQEDRSCPPSCVTCGCCAQAAEPAIVIVPIDPDEPVVEVDAVISRIPQTRARDVLHVPKPRLA